MLLLLLSHFSRVQLCATPWTAAYQAPLSTEFFRQEYWSGLPLPSPWCSINIYKINELYWIQGSWLSLVPDPEAGDIQQCKCLILLDLKDFCSYLPTWALIARCMIIAPRNLPVVCTSMGAAVSSPGPGQRSGCMFMQPCAGVLLCVCKWLVCVWCGIPSREAQDISITQKKRRQSSGLLLSNVPVLWGEDRQSCLILLSPLGQNLRYEGKPLAQSQLRK